MEHTLLGNSRYCTTIELDCIVFNKGQINQDECGCFKNCNEIKFILQFFKSITWFQNSTVTWELIHKKIRYKREILHRFSDVLSVLNLIVQEIAKVLIINLGFFFSFIRCKCLIFPGSNSTLCFGIFLLLSN